MKSSQVFPSLKVPTALALMVLVGVAWPARGQVFTVQIGSAPLPPVLLVSHGATWRYFPGTNAPPVGWQTNADAALDATWLAGPGGFGYSDTINETSLCQTVLADMFNHYTTFYVRQSFEVTDTVDAVRRLQLVMDYDDGFIAWLDGVEVARSANAPGAVGTEPPYTAISGAPNHESSRGTSGLPPLTNDLGLVGARLQPGTHVLAVMGLNGAANSSDFVLIPDLRVTGGQGVTTEGAFFTLINSNGVTLSGSNTLAGTVGVSVNGVDATFDPGTGLWARAQPLAPGFNRLFMASLDVSGAILASTTKDIVSEIATTRVGGTLPDNTTWTAAQSTIRVTNDLIVPAGVTLTLGEGTVVLLSPNASIRAEANGVVLAQGTEAQPVYLLPADGSTQWREVSARGAGASVTLRGVELVAGQVIAHPSAAVTIEDSLLRDFRSGTRLFLTATNAAQFVARRSQIERYDQIRFSATPVRLEDCLFQHIESDATDLADHADIRVTRTTYRFGSGSNTDALDLGNNAGMIIEHCLIHDFPDKGVSVANSSGVIVRGSLIYNTGIGIATYASSNCVYYQNTIADSAAGLSFYTRAGFPGPGSAFASNNIVWGNTTNIHLSGGGSVDLAYSDVAGGVWPGTGNLSVDPLFVDAARHDYRLAAGSPVIGQGLGGVDMGAAFPVGGRPPAPFSLTAHAAGTNAVQLGWQEDADNEVGFAIERSLDASAWQPLGDAGPNATSFTDPSAALEQLYFYRVRATNDSGRSRFSNVASAIRRAPVILAGGVLTGNTVWAPEFGPVIVYRSVTVPTNVTLTMLPGASVHVTNGAAIRAAQGGTILVEGTAANPVHLAPLTSSNLWGELSAQFAGSSLTIRHADIAGGQVTVYSNAVLLLEDSYLHDYRVLSGGTIFNQPLVLAHYAQPTVVRRCILRNYHETLFRNGRHLIEDCLFEHMAGDALDFDSAQPGTLLRRCTFRHGNGGNIDAVDVGPDGVPSQGVIIEDCLMYDFPFDKGVSIGENSFDITVRNCLIHHVARGVQVKDVSTASVYQNTIVHAEIGLHGFEKFNGTGAGRLTNGFNNILWQVTNAIVTGNNSIMNVSYTDMQHTNWPGPGNIDADPRFVNFAELDCRLQPDSPCLGTGLDGADMGARLPVGALMAPSNPTIDLIYRDAPGASTALLRFWADSERSYSVQWSEAVSGGTWQKVMDVFPQTLPRPVVITNAVGGSAHRFYRLVSPAQP